MSILLSEAWFWKEKYGKHRVTRIAVLQLVKKTCISHRITEPYRLEGTSGGFYSNLLLRARAALRSHQAAQDSLQLYLENFQVQRWHKLSRKPAPLYYCPHRKQVFPYTKSCIPLLFQLMPIAFCSLTTFHCEEFGSVSLTTLQVL